MCNDMKECILKAKKKAVRTMEEVLGDKDTVLDMVQLEKIHHAIDIIKAAEKLVPAEEPQE